MSTFKSYKFRVYPTDEQIILMNKTLGCVRFVYNFCRAQQKKSEDMWLLVQEMVQQGYFTENNFKSNFFQKNENIKSITQLKENYEWLKEVDNTALQCSVENLAAAYDRYYKHLGGKPKFKSKRNPVQSYTSKCNKTNKGGTIRIEGDSIQIPKVGKVKFETADKLKDKVQGRIMKATVLKTSTQKFYISLTCEVSIEKKPKTNKNIGLDLGIKEFCVLSNGDKKPNHKYLSKSLDKIIKFQKQLSRKQIGSSNWNKTKLKLAKAYEKVNNQRNDFLQKLSTEIINKYDIICMEDLQVKNMVKNHKLAQSILDVSWTKFKEMLIYKAKWYGKTISKVSRYYASSQICNVCGYKNEDIKDLDIREWKCPCCNTEHDRDVNASINILKEGLRLLNI